MTTPTSPVLIGASGTIDPATLNATAASLAQRWRSLATETAGFTKWNNGLPADAQAALWAITDPDAKQRNDYSLGLLTTLAAIFFGQSAQPDPEDFNTGLTEMAGPP